MNTATPSPATARLQTHDAAAGRSLSVMPRTTGLALLAVVCRLLALAFFCDLPAHSQEGTAASAFDAANRLYEQGRFKEATAAYQKLIDRGEVSPTILFNLGNACLKSGQLGHAIANYRLARALAPRNRDVEHNLARARSLATGASPSPPRSEAWLRRASVDELTVSTLAGCWITFAALTGAQLGQRRRDTLRALAQFSGLITVLLGFWLGWRWRSDIASHPAVVVVPEAVVRRGPFEESQSTFTLRDGAEIRIENRKANWCQILDASGRPGWVRRETIRELGTGPGREPDPSPTPELP